MLAETGLLSVNMLLSVQNYLKINGVFHLGWNEAFMPNEWIPFTEITAAAHHPLSHFKNAEYGLLRTPHL